MKLRVPEYYSDFVCTADRCKDSCCIGWEIDIDEDTRVYYNSIPGPFGERLRQHMFSTEDEDVFHFELQKKGHCPFLNDTNLCEICIELGEEALSEVCTEYPRFSLAYGDVLQKVLSLSCEEAGRLLFSKKEPLRFVEMGEIGEFERMEEESEERLQFFEYVQDTGIELLQERSRSLGERIERFLGFAEQMQSRLNSEQLDCPLSEEELENCCAQRASQTKCGIWEDRDYAHFLERFQIFQEMEVLGQEWADVKKQLQTSWNPDNYAQLYEEFVNAKEYSVVDGEHVAVYAFFRYFMSAVYDDDILSRARMAVVFARMFLDLEILRYHANGKTFSDADRIDVARVFSKEVEHSEEHIEQFREEMLFFKI